jgi:AraC-like DNA-binding protein
MENWDRINAVQRMQDYIEQNIDKPITLYELSRYAAYSPYHCERIFALFHTWALSTSYERRTKNG